MVRGGILQTGNNNLLKKFYLWTFLISVFLAVICYIYFVTEKPIYKASGKFTYFYSGSINSSSANLPYVSDPLSKSIAESISTASFVQSLYSTSKINFDLKYLDKPTGLVRAAVLNGSNVIQIQIFSTDKNALSKLSQNVFPVLEKSPLIASTSIKPQIEILDQMHIQEKAGYPRPLEYAGIVFLGSFLISLMFLYIFFSNES